MKCIIQNNIHDNDFYDESAVTKMTFNDNSSNELDEIRDELMELKEELNQDSALYYAIEDLRQAVEKGNKPDISTAIKKHIKEFSMPFFVKVASQTLMNFIDLIK